jgi:NSS family neurotransmitter:Na+ symporter
MAESREQWTSRLGFILAAAGSAVGLGNIWKFPYLVGEHGGAVFILIYLICVAIIGLPVVIAEIVMGRNAQQNPVGSFRRLSGGKPFWMGVGFLGIATGFIILSYYNVIAGWCLGYIVESIRDSFSAMSSTGQAAQLFRNLSCSGSWSIPYQTIFMALTVGIIYFGVTKGIEKASKILMPSLILIILVLVIRGITLENSRGGIEYLLKPNLEFVTIRTVLVALGQAFFSLSLGMGVMITYGSYFRDDQDIPGTAFRVAFSDLAVSLLAGIAIFPAVFAFGYEPNAGPSLLFLTIPSVFASMPLGNVFMVIFFILTFIASIGAQISLVEVPVAFLEEKFHLSRKVASISTVVAIAVFGALAALSNSLLADVKLLGMTFFDLFDYTTSNILLPLGGLFIAIFISWVWGKKKITAALTNDGKLANTWIVNVLYGTLLVVTPILVTIVLLNGLKIIQ